MNLNLPEKKRRSREWSFSQLEQFSKAARLVAKKGLVLCSSGNLSWRISQNTVLLSATGSWMERMNPEKIAVCSLPEWRVLNHKKPSLEAQFHQGIYANRKDISVILHFQSRAATTIACMEIINKVNHNHNEHGTDPFFLIPELPCYVGAIGRIDYLKPGSKELAHQVIEVMKTYNLALMKNHGQIVVGRNFDEALERALFFELACQILTDSGFQAQPMSEENARQISPQKGEGKY